MRLRQFTLFVMGKRIIVIASIEWQTDPKGDCYVNTFLLFKEFANVYNSSSITKTPLSKFYRRDVDEVVDDSIDSEACRTVYLQLAGYVSAVGNNSVHRYAEVVGNLLVRHTLHQ